MHTLTISATDGANTDTATLTVNVNNVLTANPTITDSNATANTVAENAAIGTVVGVTASAAFDAGDSASVSRYEITASAGNATADTLGKFAINPSTGVVTVAEALDYETDTSHTITVKATSTDGQDNTQTFTINVTDVTTEGPSIADQVVALNEGVAAATSVHNFADASG